MNALTADQPAGRTDEPGPSRLALSADLRELTVALGDSDVALDDLLASLIADVTVAVPSYLGMTMSLVVGGYPVGWTLMEGEDQHSRVIAASVRLPLPSLCTADAGSALTFYSTAVGAFVDFAADVVYAVGLDAAEVVVDRHLSAPSGGNGITGLSDRSIMDRAVGILAGRRGGLNGARDELHRIADGTDQSVLSAARQLVHATTSFPDRA